MKAVAMLCLFFCISVSGWSNNVKLAGTVRVTDVSGGVATLEVDLSWENSWRDNFNWDAVWLFVKVKPAGSAWSHANLQDVVHTVSGDFNVMNGKSASNVTGVYVCRGGGGAGAASTKVTLKYACSYSKVDFDKNRVFLQAQAIEMVYVPYGAYYLGDGHCANRFTDATDKPVLIDSEDARSVGVMENGAKGSPTALPAAYPKGYQGFYVMKYELSQEQYVAFLNTLSKTEQESLLGAERLAGLSVGGYLFGSASRTNYRNGIVLSGKPANQAYLFDCNLNGNSIYGEEGDGQCIACNYLSVNDLLAYAAWSGLRPMSELEYERACRAPYPQDVLPGEYVWNSTGGLSSASSVGASGQKTESVNSGANINSGNALSGINQGPLRCGIFATATSTQPGAGATYWGVMEMGGNVRELVAGINNTGFSKATNGAGAFSTSRWSVTPAHYGVRGGDFTSPDSLLRGSDRTGMSGTVTSLTVRDSTTGFRLARTLDASPLLGGTLTIQDGRTTACPGDTLKISGSTVVSDAPVNYLWYVKVGSAAETLVPSQTGIDLNYDGFANTTSAAITYTFRRKAFSAVGEGWSDSKSVTVSNTGFTIAPTTAISLDLCDVASGSFVATAGMSGGTFTWSYKGGSTLTTGKAYKPDRSHFGLDAVAGGQLPVTCKYTIGGCTKESSVLVDVAPGNIVCPANVSYGSEIYNVVRIGCQCWMARNLNVGTFTQITNGGATGAATWTFDEAGIQKWCIGGAGNNISTSNESNCAIYGGLYEWWEVVCGGKCNGSVTPANAQSLTLNSESELTTYAKMVPGSTTLVQGICPDGWHIPTDAEWGTLGSNQTGWGAKLGGSRGPDGSGFYNFGSQGRWWSSTPISSNIARTRYLTGEAIGSVLYQNNLERSYGLSVRCVKNY